MDRLLDALWDSSPPPSALTSLQVMVHRLRRALGPDQTRLVTERRGYRLTVGAGELDLTCFEELAAQAREALGRHDYPGAAADLRQALGLWRGSALEGATTTMLLQNEIVRLEEARQAVLEDRIEADLSLGRHPELVAELAALVAAHPLRERLLGQLMLALYRSGRPAEALAAYRRARQWLVRELGIEPGPRLQQLHVRILHNATDLLLADPAVASATRPVWACASSHTTRQTSPAARSSWHGCTRWVGWPDLPRRPDSRRRPCSARCTAWPVSVRHHWRSISRTRSPTDTPTVSCISTCTVSTRARSRCRLATRSAGCCARCGLTRPLSRPSRMNRRPSTVRCWPAGDCCSYSTMPPRLTRYGRYCPAPPAASSW